METNWFVIPTREALSRIITDADEAGEGPYLVIALNDNAIVFDAESMHTILLGYTTAVTAQQAQTQDGDDGGS